LGVLGLFSLSNYQRFKENFYLKKLRKAQVLESLLLFGLTVSTIGLFVILESVEVWKNYGFASLQSASLLSQLTPGVLSLLIGIQLMFTSFLFETIKSNLNKLD
jgi:pilus assembly protein TadC